MRISQKIGFFGIAAMAVALLLNTAQATLVSGSSGFGANTITLDTATGLEWLDPSITTNQSIDDILAKLAPGQQFSGFSYATDSALGRLFVDAGLPTTSNPQSANAGDVTATSNLIALLGQTYSLTLGNGDVARGTNGFLVESGLIGPPTVFQSGNMYVRTPCFGASSCAGWLPIPELSSPSGERHDIPGTSFLIRESSSGGPLPEPSTVLLLGLAGIALLVTGRTVHPTGK